MPLVRNVRSPGASGRCTRYAPVEIRMQVRETCHISDSSQGPAGVFRDAWGRCTQPRSPRRPEHLTVLQSFADKLLDRNGTSRHTLCCKNDGFCRRVRPMPRTRNIDRHSANRIIHAVYFLFFSTDYLRHCGNLLCCNDMLVYRNTWIRTRTPCQGICGARR